MSTEFHIIWNKSSKQVHIRSYSSLRVFCLEIQKTLKNIFYNFIIQFPVSFSKVIIFPLLISKYSNDFLIFSCFQ